MSKNISAQLSRTVTPETYRYMTNYSAEAKRNRRAAARSSMTTVAEHRKCPRCLRKAALSARVRWENGSARECLYCGHTVGIIDGEPFGWQGVVPEPGAKR